MSQASNDTIDFHYRSGATDHETNGVYKTNATESGKTVYCNDRSTVAYDATKISSSSFSSNTSDYVDTNNYLYTGQWYWTMPPVYFSSVEYAYDGYVRGGGLVCSDFVDDTFGVRPAVSLVDGTLVGSSGDGSSNNPYVVE